MTGQRETLSPIHVLGNPIKLPCGAVLKNRLIKSPMTDSLANGEGDPTEAQLRLYERWAEGGTSLSLIGEVQVDPRFPENPGNLVLGTHSDQQALRSLVERALIEDAHFWPQLGHAGARAHPSVSEPRGPSALDMDGLQCAGMSVEDIQELPGLYARTAAFAKDTGFSGVQIHAGHGWLLSQFLSPLFNRRSDGYGGSVEARCRIVLEVIDCVRRAVGPSYPVGIRINATDKMAGGLTEDDALAVVRLLDQTSIDLIDFSGGTYFPGAKASSDGPNRGPYFLETARRAKGISNKPLMATGGFRRREQAVDAVASGAVDMVGLARAMVLDPQLANAWLNEEGGDPEFPVFEAAPPGGVTDWYIMRLLALGEDQEDAFALDIPSAMHDFAERTGQHGAKWRDKFARLSELI
ncbi:MAG: NADH:flavin oxidoreductase/NADH oxidase family protein [Pseudomonadota bacterium]